MTQRALAVAGVWLGLLGVLLAIVLARLELSGDLRAFMPEARTAEQALLLEQVGEGPGARLWLLAIDGAPPAQLAQISHDLRERLRDAPALRRIENGGSALQALPEELLAYRYLLSPTLDTQALDGRFLREQLQQRLQDLASPAGTLVEDWLARDPTLETLEVVERWQPAGEPETFDEVWFDAATQRVLLVAETQAAGFDPQGQRQVQHVLQQAFDAARGDSAARLLATGPGAFSVLMRETTQREATRLGIAATVLLVLLLGIAYRSWRAPLLAALPLATGILAGIAAVALAFGPVHGITLAFGITLIGVAQDYPAHLFSHLRPGVPAAHSARAIWPTLRTGVLSTCLAYLAFFASGAAGLQQLAVFAVTGLAVAGISTRYLLPALLPAAGSDLAHSPRLVRLAGALARLPRPAWLPALLGVLALTVLWLAPGPWWENNLATLTPVPRELLEQDQALRRALGAPDLRHLLLVEGRDVQDVLQQQELLAGALDGAVDAGDLDAYQTAAQLLPSADRQRARQSRLPEARALAAALLDAQRELPFRADAFTEFLDDAGRARSLAPLTPQDLADTPLAARLDSLLRPRGDGMLGVVALHGVHQPAALARLAEAAGAQVYLLDLKAASESLVASYRERVLWALALAAVLLIATVWLALRRARRVARVLLPVALATLLVLALLHGGGVALSLFHLIALILAAGLGLDYALFFERAADDPSDRPRTLHALIVCALSTLFVFALLATSSMPVLRAIGGTVALGVLCNFVLAALIAGRVPQRA